MDHSFYFENVANYFATGEFKYPTSRFVNRNWSLELQGEWWTNKQVFVISPKMGDTNDLMIILLFLGFVIVNFYV